MNSYLAATWFPSDFCFVVKNLTCPLKKKNCQSLLLIFWPILFSIFLILVAFYQSLLRLLLLQEQITEHTLETRIKNKHPVNFKLMSPSALEKVKSIYKLLYQLSYKSKDGIAKIQTTTKNV